MMDAKVVDPHQLIASIKIAGEDEGRTMLIIEYRGRDPLYKLETEPLGAILTIKEGKSRKKAVVTLSGITRFKPRDLPNRTMIFMVGGLDE